MRPRTSRRRGERGFRILASPRGGEPDALVSPDTATCEACLAELFDPSDRRYRYPFINCTDCGPRFTIVSGVPYDRPLTTMAGFVMCTRCSAEYDDPARPPLPRPAQRLPGRAGRACGSLPGDDYGDEALRRGRGAARALRDGAIVAVKGIGGFHLACRADDEARGGALRARKHREDRPFALMVRDVGAARELVALDAGGGGALRARARPIVLAPRRAGARVAPRRPALAPSSASCCPTRRCTTCCSPTSARRS